MSERGGMRGAGAPFYAPPRRKTSAEIISEARAAIYGDGSTSASPGGGALRPLRTRRPFTPREPQRTLFTDRRNEPRPPSSFTMKYLSLSESAEDAANLSAEPLEAGLHQASHEEVTDVQSNLRKKPTLRNQSKSLQERVGDGWSGFTKLPHLSGRSKPLHNRRNHALTTDNDSKCESDLNFAISISQPLAASESRPPAAEALAARQPQNDSSVKRRQFSNRKSMSHDTGTSKESRALGNIGVKHLAVQIPSAASTDKYESLSILEISEALSQKSSDLDRVLLLLEVLQNAIETQPPSTSLRDMAIRSLYTYIDVEDERVVVAIVRVLLTLRVTGPHLATACKLIFKITRNDKNDHFFRNTNLLELLVEGCGRLEPVSEGDSCVYLFAALRFLALEPRVRAAALRSGAAHILALHLKLLNNAKSENPRGLSDQSTHALFQLTGALRNLAGSGGRDARAFVPSGALAELLNALGLHQSDRDVHTNVVRCLSVLSAEESCCAWVCAARGAARALVCALAASAARGPLALRLAYTLGNMAAHDEHARLEIYNEEGSMDVLLTILETYAQKNERDKRDPDGDPDLHLIGSDLGGSDGSNEDVLIKTVRVVANLCLAERVGRHMSVAHDARTIQALLGCLIRAEKTCDTAAVRDTEEEDVVTSERREELATAALAALNNVTFYREAFDSDPIGDLLEKLCRVTCRWLSGPDSAACEAVRALGNLSRCPQIAQLIVLDGSLDSLTPFLDHEEESVRCAAAGVLVNVCGAGAGGAGGEAVARALAAAAAARDPAAAALLARALWNALAHHPLSSPAVYQATTALDLFIDDESVFAACEASRHKERRASDPELSKNHVQFNDGSNPNSRLNRAYSVDQDLHHTDAEEEVSGEDLGFEDGDPMGETCECGPCRRLAAWEELVGVAIPLLEKLRPHKTDASVGTD